MAALACRAEAAEQRRREAATRGVRSARAPISTAPLLTTIFSLTFVEAVAMSYAGSSVRPRVAGQRKETSMSALLRSVPHVDLEAAAMHGIAEANRAAVLIFDLFGVWKSKPRGGPRLLHVENRKNQNPVSSGRVRTAGRASDINQCFFKIRTSTENLGFCSRKSKEIKTRGGAARLIYFWKSKTPRKSWVSSKKISNKSNNSNADVRRPGTRAAPRRT